MKVYQDNYIRFEPLLLEAKLNCHYGSLAKMAVFDAIMDQVVGSIVLLLEAMAFFIVTKK